MCMYSIFIRGSVRKYWSLSFYVVFICFNFNEAEQKTNELKYTQRTRIDWINALTFILIPFLTTTNKQTLHTRTPGVTSTFISNSKWSVHSHFHFCFSLLLVDKLDSILFSSVLFLFCFVLLYWKWIERGEICLWERHEPFHLFRI